MQFLDLAPRVIPGYDLLSQEQWNAFEQTEAGQQFVGFVKRIILLADSELGNSTTGGWRGFWSVVSGNQEAKREKLQQKFSQEKQALIAAIAASADYKALINQIICKILEQEFSDFSLLNPQEQNQLASAEFSKSLQSELAPVISAYNAELQIGSSSGAYSNPSSELRGLEARKKAIFEDWYRRFCESQEMVPLRERIVRQQALERADALVNRLPILNNSLVRYNRQAYIDLYINESKKAEPDFDLMEATFLTSVLDYYIKQATIKRIQSIDLQDFNRDQAERIANKILEAIKEDNELEIESWLIEFQTALEAHIQEKLRQINGRSRQVVAPAEDDSGMLNSLSYLFWQNSAVRNTTDFFNKLADAHAFIQYTGMSTQNESSFLAIVDIYNYYRAADQIKETSTILLSLSTPFLPLYQEYKEIGLYEKNVYRKVFRTLMPLLIVAGVVVLIAALLSPLAIPELAFLVVTIPALFLGAFLASKYVTLKNELYQYLRNKCYGGPYEIPEFQINERMILIFGSEANAEIIRGIYLDELKACDELDKSYCARADNGLLNEAQLELKKENMVKRHRILLEWYDIHSNNNLGFDKVPQIVMKRLESIVDEETKKMEKAIRKHDLQLARQCAKGIVDEVKAVLTVTLTGYAATSTATSSRAELVVNTRQGSAANGNSGVRFFRSLSHRDKAALVDSAMVRLQQPPPQPTTI